MTAEHKDAATLAFYEESAALYADQWNNPAMMADPRARLMATHPAPAHLLDLGCGTGRDAFAFGQAGYQVTGLDYSPAMLAEARALCADLSPIPAFVHGDMRALPFEASGFDVVWMSASLLHLTRPDASRALAEIRRVLRPSGHLYVTVKDGAGSGFDPTGRFYTFWDAASFAADVAAAGFEITEDWPSLTGEVAWLNVIAAPRG